MEEMHMKLVAAEERIHANSTDGDSVMNQSIPSHHRSTSHLSSPTSTPLQSKPLQNSQPYILDGDNQSIELLHK